MNNYKLAVAIVVVNRLDQEEYFIYGKNLPAWRLCIELHMLLAAFDMDKYDVVRLTGSTIPLFFSFL